MREPKALFDPRVSQEEMKELRDKYLRVFSGPDGLDVLTDIMLRLCWQGTLDSDTKVILHNAANELFAFLTGTMTGGDYNTDAYQSQLRSAIGREYLTGGPPQIKTGVRDSART